MLDLGQLFRLWFSGDIKDNIKLSQRPVDSAKEAPNSKALIWPFVKTVVLSILRNSKMILGLEYELEKKLRFSHTILVRGAARIGVAAVRSKTPQLWHFLQANCCGGYITYILSHIFPINADS